MKLNSSLFFLSFTHERGTGSRAVSHRSGERIGRPARPCYLWLTLSPAEWLSDQPRVWALPDVHRWGVWVIGENRFCSSTAVPSFSSEPDCRKQHFSPAEILCPEITPICQICGSGLNVNETHRQLKSAPGGAFVLDFYFTFLSVFLFLRKITSWNKSFWTESHISNGWDELRAH